MRLTEEQISTIKTGVREKFGPDAQVWLFGSRVDDNERGGDIDLMIEADVGPQDALDRELALYSWLIRQLGERRIDIVVHGAGKPLQPIHKVAIETGTRL